ncbi:MAG: sugar phosphate isomerase/epimerase, partial [Alphaproteobacteria bacterium]
CHERAWPDGYQALRGGAIGHIHIKDVWADTARSWLEVRPMGQGMLAEAFAPIAAALRAEGYAGAISYESVYHPGNGVFEDGFRQCIGTFLALFGPAA